MPRYTWQRADGVSIQGASGQEGTKESQALIPTTGSSPRDSYVPWFSNSYGDVPASSGPGENHSPGPVWNWDQSSLQHGLTGEAGTGEARRDIDQMLRTAKLQAEGRLCSG